MSTKTPSWYQPITESIPLDSLGYVGASLEVVVNPTTSFLAELDKIDAIPAEQADEWRAARVKAGEAIIVEARFADGSTATPAELDEYDQRILSLAFSEMAQRREAALKRAFATFHIERITSDAAWTRARAAEARGTAEAEREAVKPAAEVEAPTAAEFKRRFGGGTDEDAE